MSSPLPPPDGPPRDRLVPITVPDLGLGDRPITVSVWLVPPGVRVTRGDRVVELMAGDATVDLSAPATGGPGGPARAGGSGRVAAAGDRLGAAR